MRSLNAGVVESKAGAEMGVRRGGLGWGEGRSSVQKDPGQAAKGWWTHKPPDAQTLMTQGLCASKSARKPVEDAGARESLPSPSLSPGCHCCAA